jgi:hypothetical protein
MATLTRFVPAEAQPMAADVADVVQAVPVNITEAARRVPSRSRRRLDFRAGAAAGEDGVVAVVTRTPSHIGPTPSHPTQAPDRPAWWGGRTFRDRPPAGRRCR